MEAFLSLAMQNEISSWQQLLQPGEAEDQMEQNVPKIHDLVSDNCNIVLKRIEAISCKTEMQNVTTVSAIVRSLLICTLYVFFRLSIQLFLYASRCWT